MNGLYAATLSFHINTQEFSANNIFNYIVLCFNPESFLRASLPFPSIYLFLGVSCSLLAGVHVFVFAFIFRKPPVFALRDSSHFFEISDDSRMRIT